nr:MAG TPA: hypothetical protein [Caudoviricetes sp.]
MLLVSITRDKINLKQKPLFYGVYGFLFMLLNLLTILLSIIRDKLSTVF